ncbi:MAG: hypothetical protein IPK87_16915 [Planctomycetes bacterium]|nr:hypothetical protein [Planctomycetota bacterium]
MPISFLYINVLSAAGAATPFVIDSPMPALLRYGIAVVVIGSALVWNYRLIASARMSAKKLRVAANGYLTWAVVGNADPAGLVDYTYLTTDGKVRQTIWQVNWRVENTHDQTHEPLLIDLESPHEPFFADDLFPGTTFELQEFRSRVVVGRQLHFMLVLLILGLVVWAFASLAT